MEPALSWSPRFGRDFGGVRVHTDSEAAESARAVDAHAYTVGQHIVFDSGKYDPHSGSGQHLLAHELAHTVQQRNVGQPPSVLPLRETPEYNHLENEADNIARSVMHRGGAPAPAVEPRPASRPVLARDQTCYNHYATHAGRPGRRHEQSPGDDSQFPNGGNRAACAGYGERRQWQPVTTAALKQEGAKAYAVPPGNADVVAVQMTKAFELPPEKGPVLEIWKKQAKV